MYGFTTTFLWNTTEIFELYRRFSDLERKISLKLTFHNPEFEQEVRRRLQISEREISLEDAQLVKELDLTSFTFCNEDIDTLICFNELRTLDINLGTKSGEIWNYFPRIEKLYWCCWGTEINFTAFSNMQKLRWLCVSGGDYSDINYYNLDSLIALKELAYLELHEFGTVDIAPLAFMPQLRAFALRYAANVDSINAISAMVQLDNLVLAGLFVEDLDFLDTLPDSVKIEMCGIDISGIKDVDVKKWARFSERDISEISINDQYIDLT
ncbi:MAG: hypothetical protein ACOX81_07065 [Candidatus Heteroscillospira sp.]|jgi:hypothetical protein